MIGGAAACAMLALGAFGGLAAYEALVRYAAPARRDAVFPAYDGGSEGEERACARQRQRRAREALGALARLLDRYAPLTHDDVESGRERLNRAGLDIEPETWRSVRAVAALGAAGAAGVLAAGAGLPPAALAAAMGCFAACGWMVPSWALSRRERRRRRAIERALPDAMELLGIAIAAGSPIEQCFREVADSMDGPLAQELSLVDKEVNLLGHSREDALQHLGRRCRSHDVGAFAAQLIQAVSQGSSLAEGLAAQAALARETAQADAMERIRKMPTKLDIVLSLCFLPPTVALVMVPTVVDLLDFLNGSML